MLTGCMKLKLHISRTNRFLLGDMPVVPRFSQINNLQISQPDKNFMGRGIGRNEEKSVGGKCEKIAWDIYSRRQRD